MGSLILVGYKESKIKSEKRQKYTFDSVPSHLYDGDIWKIFYKACFDGKLDDVKFLLGDPYIDINGLKGAYPGGGSDDVTGLDIVCEREHHDLIKLFLSDYRINLNWCNNNTLNNKFVKEFKKIGQEEFIKRYP